MAAPLPAAQGCQETAASSTSVLHCCRILWRGANVEAALRAAVCPGHAQQQPSSGSGRTRASDLQAASRSAGGRGAGPAAQQGGAPHDLRLHARLQMPSSLSWTMGGRRPGSWGAGTLRTATGPGTGARRQARAAAGHPPGKNTAGGGRGRPCESSWLLVHCCSIAIAMACSAAQQAAESQGGWAAPNGPPALAAVAVPTQWGLPAAWPALLLGPAAAMAVGPWGLHGCGTLGPSFRWKDGWMAAGPATSGALRAPPTATSAAPACCASTITAGAGHGVLPPGVGRGEGFAADCPAALLLA